MPLTDDFWVWVEDSVAALDQLTYYQLLGVPEDADPPLVSDTYYALVRRIHPDRHPREDARRKAALVRLYARIGEAHRVLGNPGLRARYDRVRAEGATRLAMDEATRPSDPDREKDPKNPQARSLYEKGLALIDERDKRGARAQLQLALGFEPGSLAIKEALQRLEGRAPEPPREATPEPEAPAPPTSSWLDELPEPKTPPPVPVAAPPPEGPQWPRGGGPRKVRLRCSRWDQVATLYRRELQRGTMFLRAPRPLPAGTLVQVVLALPDGSAAPLDGRVERSVEGGEHPGMAIRFTDPLVARPLEQRLREVGYDD